MISSRSPASSVSIYSTTDQFLIIYYAYWKEIAYTHAEYNMGYGIMFPEKHFEMYGSGFSNLPQELGGQVSGDKSRFAGTPNQ